jgi:hypothetical protein
MWFFSLIERNKKLGESDENENVQEILTAH